MAEAGLGTRVPPVGVGLNEPETMAERTRQTEAMERFGVPPRDAAQATGAEQFVLAHEQRRARRDELAGGAEDEFGYGDLARYGLQRGAEQTVRGGARLADEWLDMPENVDEAAEAAATAIGPSEEQNRAAAEFMSDKGVVGQAVDAVVSEAPMLAGTVAAGAAAGSVVPGIGTAIGTLLGAVTGIARVFDQGAEQLDEYNRTQIAAERGVAPEDVSDDEVKARFSADDRRRATAAALTSGAANALPVWRILSKLPGGNRVLQRTADQVVEKRSLLAGAGREATKVGVLEGAQEVGEELALDILTNRALHDQIKELPDQEIRTVVDFVRDVKGEDYAVAFLAGLGLGGPAGAATGAAETSAQNKIAENRAQRLMGMAQTRGASIGEIEERLKADPERKRQLPRVAATLDRQQTYLDQAEELLREAQAKGGSDETIASLTELRDRRAGELERTGDGMGKWLGIEGWKTAADVRRQNADNDTQQRQDALDRLRERGEKVTVDVDAKTAADVAERIEAAEAAYETADSRHQAIANPERKAQARAELDEARRAHHEARIEAAQKLRGRTHAQAVREVDKQDRLDRQREAREEAIARQAELELPETMEPGQRKARAQEIVDAFEANPMEGTKGLQSKLKRLQRQRRAATTPETIDRLNDEIADLEARRGLSPPAVEAARRVLQAEGPAAQAGLEEASPEAGEEAEAEGTPEAEVSEPAGEADGEGMPNKSEAEPAGPSIETIAPRAEPQARAELTESARQVAEGRATPWRRRAFAVQLRNATGRPAEDIELDARAAEIVEAAGPAPEPEPEPDRSQTGAGPEPGPDEGFPVDFAWTEARQRGDTREGTVTEKFQARAAQQEPWVSLRDEFAGLRGFDVVEAAMAEWTRETGNEVAAHLTPDGEIIAIGTNNLPDRVMPPARGFGDPEVIFTHTHPKGMPFSHEDVRAMFTDGGQVFRAVMPDGRTTEMQPLRAITEQEMFALEDAVFDQMIDAHGPIENFNAVYSDAVLQALDAADVIAYAQPYDGLTDAEREIVNATIDTVEPAIADLRRRTDGRPGPAEDRSLWGSGSRPRAETEEDVEGDEDLEEDVFGEGGRVSTKRRGRERAAADPERVAELARDVIARSNARVGSERSPVFDRAIKDGEITEKTIADALMQLVQSNGNKRHYAVHFAAQKLFPDTDFGDRMTLSRELDKPDRFTGKRNRIYSYSRDNLRKINIALTLLNDVAYSGYGEFLTTANPFTTKRGMPAYNFFHHLSPELREWVGYTAPAQSQLYPPPEDPNDTSDIIRDPSKNDLTDIEPMERTARYLQRNAYDIDEGKLAALNRNDLISGKGLGQYGLKKSDLARHDQLYALDPTAFDRNPERPQGMSDADYEKVLDAHRPKGISNADWRWMKTYGKRIREMQMTAQFKLENLRDAYRRFRDEHGPDAKLGHVWQIDNRGRIYPDGEFHPQASSAIKGLFVHDGRNLVDDMVTVDASASGWQVTAIMARDAELARRVNLGRGQAAEPGYIKRDLYESSTEIMREIIADDAAGRTPGLTSAERKNAQILLDLWPTLPTGRDMVKKPIIAMNYGGGFQTFSQAFTRLLGPSLKGVKGLNKPYAYLARTGLRALERQAPNAVKFQNWSIENMTRLIRAIEDKHGVGVEPDVKLNIGLGGKLQAWKNATVDVKFTARASNLPVYQRDADGNFVRDENGNRVIASKRDDQATHSKLKVRTPNVAPERTARALWANLVQSFDAAILHRAIERYRLATDNAFVTPNHDAMTVPPEHEGAMASAYRESMREIMSQVDVPRRLYEDLVAQARLHDLDIEFEPFEDVGDYSLDDLDTATPVFGEGPKGEDYVPDYADLPAEGADLRREGGDLRQERGPVEEERGPEPDAGTALEGETPAAAETGRPSPETQAPPPPQVRAEDRERAVEVASYMQQLPEGGQTLQRMRQVAEDPRASARTFVQKVEDYIFNGFAPIRRLEERLRGELPPGAESAFKNAEMAVNDSGRQEMLLYYGGGAFGQHGEFKPAEGTIGLKSIFDMVAPSGTSDQGQRMADWQEWLAARREQQLQQRQGYKPILTEEEVAAGLAKGENRPEFERAAAEWKKFNDANLAFLRDSGRISTAQMEAMAADEFYVPFYRSDQRIDGTSPDLVLPEYKGGGKPGTLLSRDPGIHKIVGGDTMRIQNLMQNMIRNSQAMVAAGMRNRAANMTFELMTEAGMADTVPISSRKPDPNAVRMWRDGEEVWVVPRGAEAQPLMLALGGLQPLQLGRIMAGMRGVAQIFRQGITLTPPFMIRNAIRGAVSTGILTTGANLRGGHNTMTGFRDALKKGPATQAFKAMSGMGDFRFGNPETGFGKNDLLIEYGMAKPDRLYRFRQFMERMEEVGTATELADRVAAMNTMIERGMRHDEAAYQALTVMNYGRRGASPELRLWLPLIPFLNARLQGWSRITEGAVGRRGAEGRKQAVAQLVLNGMVYSAMGGAIWAWNNEDEERRERYKAEPMWKRLNFHIVYAGDYSLLIPKAFELGHIFTSIPELFADGMFNDMGGEVVPGLTKIVKDTVMFNAMPAAVVPITEVLNNYDTFRQAPIEGLREQSLRAEDRIQNSTLISQALGRNLRISDATGLSPAQIEHLLSGYAGVYYVFASTMFDVVAGDLGLGPVQATSPFGDLPFASPALQKALGPFLKDQELQTNKFVEDYYQAKDHVTQIYRSAAEAARQGDIDYARELLVEKAPNTATAYKIVNKAQSQMSDLNRQIRYTRLDEKMSRVEKQRRLQVLITTRNELTRKVMTAIRNLEKQQGASFASAS